MHILKDGQTVQTVTSKMPCTAEKFLGGGGQGEVYRADLGGQKVALKWYFPAQATPEEMEIHSHGYKSHSQKYSLESGPWAGKELTHADKQAPRYRNLKIGR